MTNGRAAFLVLLANASEGDARPALLAEALETVFTIPDTSERAMGLSDLLPALHEESALLKLALAALHALPQGGRVQM